MSTPSTDAPSFRARIRRKRLIGLTALVVVLIALLPLSFTLGTINLDLSTVWAALTNFDPNDTNQLLVVHNRIPRTLVAIVVAMALGVAGLIMQALTRNPLAEPGVLGVNAGAAAAAAIAIAVFGIVDVSGLMWFGMAGAALAGIGVYLLGGVRRGTDPIRLVLAGTAFTVVLLALMRILLVNSDDDVFDRFRVWISGSVAGRSLDDLAPASVLIAIGLILAATLPRALDTVALGDDLGAALGASMQRVWTVSAISVILLAGAATAIAGPIGFVGLAAPHLARFITGPEHRWAMPYSALVAAVLTVFADVLGRVVARPGEVSVGIMVALMGGPFFIALVRRRRLAQL